jgi:hypothetical protein
VVDSSDDGGEGEKFGTIAVNSPIHAGETIPMDYPEDAETPSVNHDAVSEI